MNKEDKQSLLLWGIVAYSVALLMYCTSKTLIGASADSISAFGSILSAIATIYATFIAIKLYADWKDPHKASFYVNECKSVLDIYKQLHLCQRNLSILELELFNLISTKNGLDIREESDFTEDELERLKTLNNLVDAGIDSLYTKISELQAEILMLAALTEDPEFLIQSISLEASLTRSYKVPREVDSNLNTLEKAKRLKIANQNNYLIVQGKELIQKAKEWGKI
ncbi:hypothetical protein ACT4VK_08835 [Acinetobacter baumannii]|uniref:hypothetical protein n=1 Tax=Acinetobacter baumannii TaxID=470 RepID=UPI0004471084|nr:hypothetical protein [Acinetobacter baumannii]EKU5044598.1 hypothetical protein [Acinetobacter baumannii]EXA58017.1 hypothetical protein J505_1100 [Acinetobacter baumannii 1297549]MCG5959462.1 hypothetical protein [Acinetobacter baumannii]MDB0178665.1 hypothetical protein [Acinetobacter baumannii]MDB0325187.1 hypothetical protein [Acinetobacter baumannii]